MFEDRESAGFLLAKKLEKFAKVKNILVLGLARGGVVTAKIIASFLEVPLDTIVVKKIGAPSNQELAIGAVGPESTVYWNTDLAKQLGVKPASALKLRQGKEREREKQERELRGQKPLEIFDKTVILVDDGVATGASIIAAAMFLKKEKAKRLILAVPVIAIDTLRDIRKYFDSVFFLNSVKDFYAVGQFYKNFPQVENEEVIKFLQ